MSVNTQCKKFLLDKDILFLNIWVLAVGLLKSVFLNIEMILFNSVCLAKKGWVDVDFFFFSWRVRDPIVIYSNKNNCLSILLLSVAVISSYVPSQCEFVTWELVLLSIFTLNFIHRQPLWFFSTVQCEFILHQGKRRSRQKLTNCCIRTCFGTIYFHSKYV